MIINSVEIDFYVANKLGVRPYFCKELSTEQEAYKFAAAKIKAGMSIDDIEIGVNVYWHSELFSDVPDEICTYVLRDEDKKSLIRKFA